MTPSVIVAGTPSDSDGEAKGGDCDGDEIDGESEKEEDDTSAAGQAEEEAVMLAVVSNVTVEVEDDVGAASKAQSPPRFTAPMSLPNTVDEEDNV